MGKKYYASSGFNPEEFEFVAFFDISAPAYQIEYDWIDGVYPTNPRTVMDGDGNPVLSHTGKCTEMIKAEGYGEFEGRCQHCGQPIRYCCIYRNIPNDELIVVGTVCADERMGLTLNEFEIKREKARIKVEETRAWNAENNSSWLTEDDSRQGLIDFMIENRKGSAEHGHYGFFHDLILYFGRHGRLTEAQERAARKSRERIEERVAKEADRLANAIPVPEGNGLQITGEVISVKDKESMYGITTKITVEAAEGYRVWGTAPSALLYEDVQPGDTVEFVANVTRSDRDEYFGFFKRPRKAAITARGAQ